MSSFVLMAAASLMNSLPATEDCTALAKDPAAALAYSSGLQGFIYGYPIVDMLKQKHNETHRVAADQPIVAPVNTMVPYPHILTPETQGQLRAPNADTLYVNAWLDLSKGPVLIETPEMNGRYYTLDLIPTSTKLPTTPLSNSRMFWTMSMSIDLPPRRGV